MHELSCTKALFDTAIRAATDAGVHEVVSFRLRLGVMRGYVGDFILHYWRTVAAGSIAERAKITIENVPVTMKCGRCGEVYEASPDAGGWLCPVCGVEEGVIISGNEFEVTDIAVR